MKELKKTASNTALRRFVQEIEVTRRLAAQHHGIVPIVDYGVPAEGEVSRPWYVMPLAEGSLEESADYKGKLDAVLELGIHLAETLSVVHAEGVIHRDLKPANLLRMAAGQVQIADFGIAYLEDPEAKRITGDRGQIVGTRPFIAPELLQRGPVTGVSAQADIYSLGKTLYAILTGAEIFEREGHRDPGFLLTEIFGDPVFEHFHGLLDRMLVDSPDRRFANMDQVKHAFERARIAVAGRATYAPGYYGTAETPAAQYLMLHATLTGNAPGRRRVRVGAVDRAVELAESHIRATANPGRDAFYDSDPGSDPSIVAARCGEFLLAAGAGLLVAEADDEALAWAGRMSGLLEPTPAGANRRVMILHDAAVYALVAAAGIAWRHDSLPFLAKSVDAYQGHQSAIYLPLLAGHAADSAEWLAGTMAGSSVLKEAEPWVASNSQVVLGLVSGLALLRRLGWTSVQDRGALEANPTDIDAFPALMEPFWGWFSILGRRCREDPAFAERLGSTIRVTSEGDFRKACVRLNPLIDRLIHARYLTYHHRSVDLRYVDRSGDWFRWIEGT